MSDDNKKGGGSKPPSTDSMLDALAAEMGVKSSRPEATEEPAAAAEAPPAEAPREEASASDVKVAEASGAADASGSCVSCGAGLPSAAKFCLECGAGQPAPGGCVSCGSELPPAAKFCLECGTAQPTAEDAAPSAPAAAAPASEAAAPASEALETERAGDEESPAAAPEQTASADDISGVASVFGVDGSGSDDDDPINLEDDDGADADELIARQMSQRRSMTAGIASVSVVILGVGVGLYVLGNQRLEELDKSKIILDSWAEMITDYDVHTEDIKAFKMREHNRRQKERVPVFGHLRIESEPQFADIYVQCEPLDTRCNNIGTKEQPRWESHYVPDMESAGKKCVQDNDCRQCRKLNEDEQKLIADGEFDPGESMVDRNTGELCHVHGTKCQAGACYLPLRTGATMQSLYLGTVGGLEESRRYAVRLEKPGWLAENYVVTAKDWSTRLDPSREDSDRTFVRRFELQPDPNAPPEIKARIDAYLKQKSEDAAAMMKEMEAWDTQ